MQMRIGLFASRAARYCALSLSPPLSLSVYLKIHSLQELLNRARLLPVSLTPLAPFRFPSPGHPVVQYLDIYELEVAYPVVHDALPQSALVHLHHIDYVPLLKQCFGSGQSQARATQHHRSFDSMLGRRKAMNNRTASHSRILANRNRAGCNRDEFPRAAYTSLAAGAWNLISA